MVVSHRTIQLVDAGLPGTPEAKRLQDGTGLLTALDRGAMLFTDTDTDTDTVGSP